VPESDTSNAGACGPVVELEEPKFQELVAQGRIQPEVKHDVEVPAHDRLVERDSREGALCNPMDPPCTKRARFCGEVVK
jgi:hypothetical protein